MPPHLVAGFLLAVLPLIATPGASFTLMTRYTAAHGARAGRPVIAGTVTGLYVHAAFATIGLSALVMRTSWAFTGIRYAGAVYLVALGLWTWRAPKPSAPTPSAPTATRGNGPFTQALLGNVLNPKAASIFLTLVPQFVDPARPLWPQVLILVTAQSALVIVWLSGWSVAIGHARKAVRYTRYAQTLRRLAATTLIALGLRTALSRS